MLLYLVESYVGGRSGAGKPALTGLAGKASEVAAAAAAAETADELVDALVDAWTDVVAGVADTQEAVLADVYRESGVSSAAFVVLSALRAAQDRRLSMHLLAARLGMTSGGFTKLADRLQAAGLIERRPSAADRRVVLAVLTDKGARSADAAIVAYRQGLRVRVAAALPASELTRLRASARRLAEHQVVEFGVGGVGVAAVEYEHAVDYHADAAS